jgi:pimeloyl-ACP methyl ester carboxylesterase
MARFMPAVARIMKWLCLQGATGSFLEYLPTVPLLKSVRKGQQGQSVSFDVVIPSLPGFGFSTLPSTSWTAADTSRVFHTLMADVLGYTTYSVFGSDWGSSPIYDMYARYPQQVRFAHFAFIPFFPPTTAELKAANITLSPYEQAGSNRTNEWDVSGNGYFLGMYFYLGDLRLERADTRLQSKHIRQVEGIICYLSANHHQRTSAQHHRSRTL